MMAKDKISPLKFTIVEEITLPTTKLEAGNGEKKSNDNSLKTLWREFSENTALHGVNKITGTKRNVRRYVICDFYKILYNVMKFYVMW